MTSLPSARAAPPREPPLRASFPSARAAPLPPPQVASQAVYSLHKTSTRERQYGRPPEPDELFMATHTNKKGEWVDSRARETYEKYHERLKVLQANSSQDSNTDVHQLDPATKLQTWKEAAGGKSRGRVYGTADLAANIRQGVSSLTQASASDTSQSGQVTENQMLRAELSMWSQKYAHLEDELKVIKDKLISMEQEKTTSNSTTQFHHEYDPEQDDQPIS